MTQERRIAVMGAGLMGHGIALALASVGHGLKVMDSSPEVRVSGCDRTAESLWPMRLNRPSHDDECHA